MYASPSHRSRGLVLLLAVLAAGTTLAAAPYVGQADVHGQRIVFTAEDDLWSCDLDGQDVRRLTSHVGTESFPHISPDGREIAFTGQYDGNADVYVIPSRGGEPRRLTWHPGPDEVMGWLADGAILLRSRRADPHGWRLYRLDPAGGDPVELPLGFAARLDVDPVSGRWAFQRTERDRRNWKRYRGGWASEIWVGHPDGADFRQVTTFAGEDAFPMWHDSSIVFLSDQGGTANLWRMQPDGSGRERLTDFENWDVRWPALWPDGTVVFTAGADLHVHDLATGRTRRVEVDLPSDRVLTRTRYRASSRDLQGFDLAPDGERLLVEVRGELFSVPVDDGVTLAITRGTGARERGAAYAHDGEQVWYWTDATGEDALHRKDAWGRGEADEVRGPEDGPWKNDVVASPDGAWLAWTDSNDDLVVMDTDDGSTRVADHGENRAPFHLRWSPDGRWLAYV
ncbi:hypothetical protein GF314_16235, partial [bacterium]|nr:hypothetical protein [bacterium]